MGVMVDVRNEVCALYSWACSCVCRDENMYAVLEYLVSYTRHASSLHYTISCYQLHGIIGVMYMYMLRTYIYRNICTT
jgi:hypothetical protein